MVLICQAGARSKNALNQARAAGRGDVRHYAGGMNGWRSRGGDVDPLRLVAAQTSRGSPAT